MSKTLLLVVCMLCLTSCFYHAYTKAEVIRHTKKIDAQKEGRVVLVDENRTLKCLIRDERFQKVDNIYEFNEQGRQTKYSVIAYCDSCFQKYLSKELSSKLLRWQKINDSTYLARYTCKRMLNVHPATFSYDIVLHSLSREAYNDLLHP